MAGPAIGVVIERVVAVAKEATEIATATEKLGKASEAGKATEKIVNSAEFPKKNFSPDKRIDNPMSSDVKANNKSFNPDERLKIDNPEEMAQKDISELAKDYLDDIKEKSYCPETLDDISLDASKLEHVNPEKVAELREEFNEIKQELRKEWEAQNGREWPKYTEDVYNNNGIKIREPGMNYDAHHIKSLELGGTNEASNITPIHVENHYDHQGVHALGSPYDILNQAVKGMSEI